MAVTSVKILHDGWTGSGTVGAGVTFNVIYQVEVDDRNDGPDVLLSADDGTTRVPRPGDSYQVGNDSDPFSFVKSVSPSPVAEKVWNVTVVFSPLEPGESEDGPEGQQPNGLDPNRRPTDNPLDEKVVISVSSVNAKRAATASAYIGQLNVQGLNVGFDATGFIPGSPKVALTTSPDGKGGIRDKTPITNSVFTPFDPPPEIDYSQVRVSINMNLKFAPVGWLDFVNSVNAQPISFTDGFNMLAGAQPFACRCMAVSYSERIKNGVFFWSTDIEFLIDNLFTHRLDILDRGYCETSNKKVSEATTKNNIVDENGLPLADPVLLDGKGKQLNIEVSDGVYLRYAVYPEFNWNWWGISNPQALQHRMNN